MITITREFDTYEEAVEALEKARAAYEVGYGFYPKRLRRPSGENPHIGNLSSEHPYGFTYSRGESCD